MRTLSYNLWRDFDDLFQDFGVLARRNNSHLSEEDDHFLMSVDLPGFKQDEIKVEVADRTLAISAESQRSRRNDGQRTYSASYTLPTSVDMERIEVLYEDGVLDIYMPKVQEAQPRQLQIQSKRAGFFEKLIGPKKSAENVQEKH